MFVNVIILSVQTGLVGLIEKSASGAEFILMGSKMFAVVSQELVAVILTKKAFSIPLGVRIPHEARLKVCINVSGGKTDSCRIYFTVSEPSLTAIIYSVPGESFP